MSEHRCGLAPLTRAFFVGFWTVAAAISAVVLGVDLLTRRNHR